MLYQAECAGCMLARRGLITRNSFASFCRAWYRPQRDWTSIQKVGDIRRGRASRRALLGVIPRWPFTISLTL
jgi:hypothetical protein